MRNLLATRFSRLFTFFLLYVTEGIPQGFAAVAIAFQMRKQGLSPQEVGAYVATLYLPWAYKVVAGPMIDLIYSERLGKRRAWIVGCQLMMSLTLLLAWPVDYSNELRLFSLIIIVHNIFAATQDVAIDALAVSTLKENERGVANGFMFAGAYTGNAIGGAGVLYLTAWIGFSNSFWLVAGSILVITVLVSLRIREPRTAVPMSRPPEQSAISGEGGVGRLLDDQAPSPPVNDRSALQRMIQYGGTLLRSMFGTVPAVAGFAFALLPTGAFAVTLTLRNNLSAEFQFADATVANLTLVGTLLAAIGCIAGGYISDRIGRRTAIGLFAILTVVPALALAWHLHSHGWIMPIDTKAPNRPTPPRALVVAFIAWSCVYAVVLGLIYGSRTAGFMDISNPAVAATQFTAYMSLMNLALAYSSYWQGWAVNLYGYPTMLVADVILGLLCLVPLALMSPRKKREPAAAGPEGVQQASSIAGSP